MGAQRYEVRWWEPGAKLAKAHHTTTVASWAEVDALISKLVALRVEVTNLETGAVIYDQYA